MSLLSHIKLFCFFSTIKSGIRNIVIGCPLSLVSSSMWGFLTLLLTLWHWYLESFCEDVFQFGFVACFLMPVSSLLQCVIGLTPELDSTQLLHCLLHLSKISNTFLSWYSANALLFCRIFPLKIFKYLTPFYLSRFHWRYQLMKSPSFTSLPNICSPPIPLLPHYIALVIFVHKHWD